MITISSTDGGLSRRPPHPLDPIRASLTLRNLLLRRRECPWTGDFLRDKDEEIGLRLSYTLVWQRNEDKDRHKDTYMMVMMKIHIHKMATHVIPGPETGDTKEIGFPFLSGKE